jgi:serine/threonine protein kinase
VAFGMEYLGTKNVVHRGLQAENVLVDGDDNPRISGFGLTEALTPELAGDPAGRVYRESEVHLRLPIRWCAPEVLEHNLFSSASDVWSFGILCIEVFTLGARPFGGWADSMVVAQVASGFTPTIPPTCPAVFFTDVIEPCFAAEPGDRPLFAKLSQATQQSTSRAATVGIARRFRHDEPEQVETRIRVSEVERGLLQSGEAAERDSPLQKSSVASERPSSKLVVSHTINDLRVESGWIYGRGRCRIGNRRPDPNLRRRQ